MENSISRQNVNVNVRAIVNDPNVTVQYKTKVLQKNVVNGVNTLTPAMISEANTKYIIKYDYTLSDDITIPANCVLDFDGGSINGGSFVGNSFAKIIASNKLIFNNVTIGANVFRVDEVLADWFYNGDLGVAGTNAVNILPNFCGTVKFGSAKYDLSTPIKVKSGIKLDFGKAQINIVENTPAVAGLNFGGDTNWNVDSVEITGGNFVVNKKPTSYYTIDIENVSNFKVNNINITYSYDNLANTDKVGVHIGRETSSYSGAKGECWIRNSYIPTIEIENGYNDSTIENCVMWASAFKACVLLHRISHLDIKGCQFVGGSFGAIYGYIAESGNINYVTISNNYFDGSYFNINTHDGIATGQDTNFKYSIISNNRIWHQKGQAIKGNFLSCLIIGNQILDCDYWNEGLPDIDIDVYYSKTIICNNIFSREKYVSPTSSAQQNRPQSDSDTFTRPAPIVLSHPGYKDSHIIIAGNNITFETYNPPTFDKFVLSVGNGELFGNTTSFFGATADRPTFKGIGCQFFDTSISPARPIWWNGTAWVDATGATV